MLPGGFEVGRRDVPVPAALFGDGAQILAEIFECGAAPEPVAVRNLLNDKTRLKNNRMGGHRIVGGIGVFGDVEIFLNPARGVGKERPVGADARRIFIGFGDVVGADGDEAAEGDLELTMEFDEEFGLAAVLGAETAAA